MEVEYNGKIYTSINSLSKDTGVNRARLTEVIKSGQDVTELIENYKCRDFDYLGEHYNNVTDFIRKNNLDECKFYRVYYKCGRSVEKTMLNYEMDTSKGIKFEYNGKYYSSQRAACADLGLDPHSVMNARKKYDTIQEALDHVIEHKRRSYRREVTYNGVTYNNLKELCEVLKIPYNSLVLIRHIHKYDVETAVNYMLNEYQKTAVTIDGTRYKSQRDMCKQLLISYTSFNRLKREGYTVEEAAALAKRYIEYKGKIYYSLAALAEDTGVGYCALTYRVKDKGESIEEAMEYLLNKGE